MTRTKLADRKLPDYTRGKEIANMTTHIDGVAYTVGIICYAFGVNRRYFHSIFHVFIPAGSVPQFVAIFRYRILT